jgi:hypothetical protein
MISRVTDSKMEDFAELLIKRLPDAFDGRSWREICTWLRAAMNGNDYYFVASDNAIGMVQKIQKRLRRHVDIEEVFMLGREMPRDTAEVKALYEHAYAWGKNFGAKTFDVGNCSDLPKAEVKVLFEALPFNTKLRIEEIPYLVIK